MSVEVVKEVLASAGEERVAHYYDLCCLNSDWVFPNILLALSYSLYVHASSSIAGGELTTDALNHCAADVPFPLALLSARGASSGSPVSSPFCNKGLDADLNNLANAWASMFQVNKNLQQPKERSKAWAIDAESPCMPTVPADALYMGEPEFPSRLPS